MNEQGTLYGVSVGPGDPELLTLKAVRIIEKADVVAVPNIGHKRQTAYQIAQQWLEGKQVLDCPTPMARDRSAALEAYAHTADALCALLAEGKTVAYLVLGDATVYSSYFYVHDLVCARGFTAEVVPGVTSFCAAAARLGMPLCEGPEQLLVVPVAAGDAEGALDVPGTKVFMKAGRNLGALQELLASKDMIDHASMVANCGLEDEAVFERFADVDGAEDYFSVVVVREK